VSSRQFLRSLLFVTLGLIAACSERLDTSNNCPLLCVDNRLVFRDTVFDIVELDSAFPGFTGVGERFPAPGLPTSNGLGTLNETFVPVINRQDSVDIRQVFRFDTLPRQLSAVDTTPITALTDSRLLLVIDTARSVIPSSEPTTVSLYDVDDSTVTDDTSASVLAARFVPGRLIASRTFTLAEVAADTINGFGAATNVRSFSISIPDSVLLRYVRSARRLRVGLRVTSPASAALRFVAPSVNSSGIVPRLTYDPSPDTAVAAWLVSTQYSNAAVAAPERFRTQTLVVRDNTPLLADGSLEVGGISAVRSLMRVKIPRSFLDTVTVVRASLDMVQRPQRTVPGARDGLRVRLRVTVAGPALGTDPRRQVEFLDPTIEGVLLPSLRLTPADSGLKSFDVGAAVRLWLAQDSTIATGFALYSEGEAFQEQRLAFYSRRNTIASLRPRLRVTYTNRREGAVP
jgi:hypothetical protein